jgi:type I restriction enzyme, S subunit
MTKSPFSGIANIDKGLSYKGSGLGAGAPLVNLANFGVDGRFHSNGLKYYSGESRDRHWVQRGSLVLANTDLTQRREILGQPALVDIEEEQALFSHHVYAIRLHSSEFDDGLMMWIYGALRQASFRDRATSYATGTTVAALPRDAVLTYELPWPETSERIRWGSIAKELVNASRGARSESRTLARMRDTLLPRLLSGELRISEAESLAGEAV